MLTLNNCGGKWLSKLTKFITVCGGYTVKDEIFFNVGKSWGRFFCGFFQSVLFRSGAISMMLNLPQSANDGK